MSRGGMGNLLRQIAQALDRIAPDRPVAVDLGGADAFMWHADTLRVAPVDRINRVPLGLLLGIDRQRDTLLENSRRFARSLPANNALLWGARGAGKSSLIKAVHAEISAEHPGVVKLVEIHREDIPTLPSLLGLLRDQPQRIVLFCDDLSFDEADTSYKSLKAVLEGGIEGRPSNLIFYATSNRRHLMPRLLRPQSPRYATAGRSQGMGDHAGRPFRPCCLAIHPGRRRPTWQSPGLAHCPIWRKAQHAVLTLIDRDLWCPGRLSKGRPVAPESRY